MRFSVIVPTRGRPEALRACLESLVALEYPRAEYEVIVVDDGAGVDPGLIDAVAGRMRARLIEQEHLGPATARNRGVMAALGEVIAFTDDDCTVDPTWLTARRRR